MIPLVSPGQPGLVVAHRGNSVAAPENTLVSEISAQRVGADVLEFDLRLTADGVPVVIHDDTVDRTTDGTGNVAQMTLAELTALDAGSFLASAFAMLRVPTYEEVLAFAATTDALVLPELKGAGWTPAQVAVVANLTRKYQLAGRTMLQSFHPEVLAIAHDEAPDIARAGLVDDIPADPVAAVRAYHGDGLLPDHRAVTADVVATLHDAELCVVVWTADDPADWARLTAIGVDGIMSNNPGRLAGWMGAVPATLVNS